MEKILRNVTLIAILSSCCSMNAEDAAKHVVATATKAAAKVADAKNFKPFTGRVTGQRVRMRLLSDTDSPVVAELAKGDYLVVAGEKAGFYMIEAPASVKAYVFRSFVLDNTIEGHHVNIRLSPDLDAPVVHHMSTGDKIIGTVCSNNSKWIEMSIPQGVYFYVAKDLIECAGDVTLKAVYDSRKAELVQLMESADKLCQEELAKSFEAIDHARLVNQYTKIAQEFADFPEQASKAKTQLAELQESYLRKKIAFLESKADYLASEAVRTPSHFVPVATQTDCHYSAEPMRNWEPVEENLFMRWSMHHDSKTMDDYYKEQRASAITVSGILEVFAEPVRNKPGSFILRDKGVPVAYLYSTRVDLQNYLGKKIQAVASPRPNNNFAFDAYYVFEIQQR